jgi:hypothetical protein
MEISPGRNVMQRMKATTIIALACLLSASVLAMNSRQPSTFSLEFHVAGPSMKRSFDVVVIARIGMPGLGRLPTAELDLAGLTQTFDFCRETAMNILFKKLHMA